MTDIDDIQEWGPAELCGRRVQEARQRQGLADFPCRSVGIVEYGGCR